MEIVKYFYSRPRKKFYICHIAPDTENFYESIIQSEKEFLIKTENLPRVTVCGIFDTDTRELRIGLSRCSPRDKFNKKRGRIIAYERALTEPIETTYIPKGYSISSWFFPLADSHAEKLLKKTVVGNCQLF